VFKDHHTTSRFMISRFTSFAPDHKRHYRRAGRLQTIDARALSTIGGCGAARPTGALFKAAQLATRFGDKNAALRPPW
jgi:hypothetical protein